MSAPDYVSVAEGRAASGLRMVFGRAVPGPWSIAARAILDIKGLDYIPLPHDAGMPNQEIVDWTGHVSAPIAMLNDDRPRAGWAEILLLAEALQPDPPLIPTDPQDRMVMFGLSYEMCGEDGFGWTIRELMFAAQRASGNIPFPTLLNKYSAHFPREHYIRRLNQTLSLLSSQLQEQKAKGSPYMVGDRLSAADLYWTAFSNMVSPMSEAACTMPDFYRQLYLLVEPDFDRPLDPLLVQHRDYILDRYLETPLCL